MAALVNPLDETVATAASTVAATNGIANHSSSGISAGEQSNP
jgi:hypothetical protein